MMRAVADLLSFYQYDETVLSELVLPEGVDKTVLINNLLMETSELEILYSDFDFLKGAIGAWSSKELPVWTELLKTTQYEYEPLWNKDYKTSHTETRNLAGTENKTLSSSEDVSRHMDDDNTYSGNNQSSAETLNSVYGYNSSTDAPADKANSSASSSTGSTDNRDISETIDRDVSETTNKGTTDTGTVKNETWERGNIGIMSTQDLIKQQREVVQFNIIDYIIGDFKKRFCLLIY